MIPFPARRDLAVLAAGLLLGILLGPPVLGAAWPSGYRALFGGSQAQAVAVRVQGEAVAARDRAREQLGLAGSAEEGPQGEARERAEANLARLEEALTRTVAGRLQAVESAMDTRAVRWVLGLAVALAGVFVAEVLAAPVLLDRGAGAKQTPESVVVSPAVRRLVTIRYALMSVVLAVILARATLYEGIPWVFVLAVLAVSLGAAWVPLGRSPVVEGSGRSINPPADPADGAPG